MGAGLVEDALPPLVEAVEESGHPVLWVCDPMHGNTFSTASGLKTRRLADIMAEIRAFFDVHQRLGTIPGGVHLELTQEDVTECLGGAEDITDLSTAYRSLCDPRLNARQSLDLAFDLSAMLQAR